MKSLKHICITGEIWIWILFSWFHRYTQLHLDYFPLAYKCIWIIFQRCISSFGLSYFRACLIKFHFVFRCMALHGICFITRHLYLSNKFTITIHYFLLGRFHCPFFKIMDSFWKLIGHLQVTFWICFQIFKYFMLYNSLK